MKIILDLTRDGKGSTWCADGSFGAVIVEWGSRRVSVGEVRRRGNPDDGYSWNAQDVNGEELSRSTGYAEMTYAAQDVIDAWMNSLGMVVIDYAPGQRPAARLMPVRTVD